MIRIRSSSKRPGVTALIIFLIRSRIVDFAYCRRAVDSPQRGGVNIELRTVDCSWRIITVISWRTAWFSLIKIRQCGIRGGSMLKDGLSI